MAENTKIEWCDHTFNPWLGCTKVSIGERGACQHCYAEVATPTRAMGIQWGAGKPRYRTSEATWALPLRWERNASAFYAVHGRRQRVFCASLADVFDNEVDPAWRADLFRLIRATPNLDWLLLTKRIGNATAMIDRALTDGHLRTSREPFWPWPNVWIGTTIANQEEADRDIPKLLRTPAHVRFLSCEPLLGPIDLERSIPCGHYCDISVGHVDHGPDGRLGHIDWVISGGESGSRARPSHPDWFRSLRDQCVASGVAYLHKQNGEWVSVSEVAGPGTHFTFPDGATVRKAGKKLAGRTLDGRVWDEFPEREVQ